MVVNLILDCNQDCLKCTRTDCNMKDLFVLPDFIFYEIILDALKTKAGHEITNNVPFEEVDLNLKKRAVALKIVRDIYLGNSKS